MTTLTGQLNVEPKSLQLSEGSKLLRQRSCTSSAVKKWNLNPRTSLDSPSILSRSRVRRIHPKFDWKIKVNHVYIDLQPLSWFPARISSWRAESFPSSGGMGPARRRAKVKCGIYTKYHPPSKRPTHPLRR